MDYEKAYKAVLKTATQWIKDGCTDKEKICLECVFPELRESEDERIRKKLYHTVMGTPNDSTWFDGTSKEAMLAWLEKQKEQKPAEKQDYSGLNDLERAIHRGFLCAGVKNVPVTIIKDTAAECMGFLALIEPKPVEWSEEDSKRYISIGTTLGTSVVLSKEDYDANMAWLRELVNAKKYSNPRPSWKPSDEQMEALMLAIEGKCPPTSYMSRRLEDLYDGLANTYRIDAKLD